MALARFHASIGDNERALELLEEASELGQIRTEWLLWSVYGRAFSEWPGAAKYLEKQELTKQRLRAMY